MKTFFTIKTAAYDGPKLGPKDTVTVEIQRYNVLGLMVSREKLDAIVHESEVIADQADLAKMSSDDMLDEPKDDEADLGIFVDDHDVPNQRDLGHEIDEEDRDRYGTDEDE